MCYSPFVACLFFSVPLTQFRFLSKISHLPIVQDNYFRLKLLQKRNLPFQFSFRCNCIFFTRASFVLSSIWVFCDSFILVVYLWSNWWNSSFYFLITPLYFIITSFSLFSCYKCFKITLLSETASSDICSVDLCSDSKNKVFLRAGKLGLIRYLLVCLWLFKNYLSVSKLNCLMILLLLLIISSLSVALGCFLILYLISLFIS